MKTACIIQGDIRDNFELVLSEMKKHFDIIIVSTWNDEKEKIPSGDFVTIFNEKPSLAGYSHRNYQRYSTSRGIQKAKELGADYVLKWRTDMLPTTLNVNQLLEWANYDIPKGLKSRIVTLSFRNLTVNEDWFSSIPDLFAFGHIDTIELLWGDYGFNYKKRMNPPEQMILDHGDNWMKKDDNGGKWCAESELYAIFKDRLQIKLGVKLSHEIIAKEYMWLFNHNQFGIVWFGKNKQYRPVLQAWEHPWWTESTWIGNNDVIYVNSGYKIDGFLSYLKIRLGFISKYIEIYKQKKYIREYENAIK